MNNTSPIYQEFLTQVKTRELESEIRQLQLVRETNPPQTIGWIAHRVAHLAEWMIATGESLRQRYDHTAMHNRASQTGALAH